ncbi:MAG: LptF/LptG family permease [Planctomycetota bacterium]|jgi:lipopolysaccharide export LptBFGC system permease protein LptF
MPRLLTRYILGDLLRVFGLTAGILVVTIAFGAAVKPLSDQDLLDVWQTAKYVGLATIPMLQFALPFAAGFAATMAMHRMASDNEIVALAAGGVNYRRILMPVAWLGLVLMVAMVGLTQWTIPRFWRLMGQTLTTDVTRLFEASIRSGRAFEVGDLQIFAEDLVVETSPPDTGADTRLILVGMAAVELDDEGRMATDITAAHAIIDVYRRDGRTYLKLVLDDTVAFNADSGELIATPRIEPTRAITVPTVFRDDPVAMTRRELLEVRENPDAFDQVADSVAYLTRALRDLTMWRQVNAALAAEAAVDLVERGDAGRRYRVRARAMRSGSFDAGRDPIVVEQIAEDGPVRRVTTIDARLESGAASALDDPSFSLILGPSRVEDLDGSGAVNERGELTIVGLGLPPEMTQGALPETSRELLAHARTIEDPPRAVRDAIYWLDRELVDTRADINAQLWYRYALAATSPLLLLLGATLAMWLRQALPLTIYLLAFVPSVIDLILISGGEQMVQNRQPLGLLFMWSGNAGLLALLMFSYRRLARH